MSTVLVTGGLGYIGSHTVVELVKGGYKPVIIDNLINTRHAVLQTLEELCGRKLDFYEHDVCDTKALKTVITKHEINAVIHFAALKAVGESIEKPLLYYKNNIVGLLSVLEAMEETNVHSLVFSSSATVYGDPDSLPITENAPLKTPTNPYGATKQFAERIITDVALSIKLRTTLLRYFNPIGAHASGTLGELPLGAPNNLVPYLTQAAAGIRKELTVFGNDYPTPDGTGIRDYIHVVDLAKAHVAAIGYLHITKEKVTSVNLGTGKGNSVLELIKTFENVNYVSVPYRIGSRRQGDIASCYASAEKARHVLGWKAEKTLEDALRDAWRWQQFVVEHRLGN